MKKEILVAISVAGVLFGLSVSLAAQEKLSLAQCREMALKYNKDMAAANKQTEAARLMSLSYKANFFPNFTANGTGIYSTADGSLGVPGGNLPVFLPNPATGELVSSGFAYFPGLNLDYKVGTVYSGGVQVEQPLYMGGKIRAAYKMSLLGKEMAHLNEALTTSEVILNTDKAYVQLVKAKEMKKVAEKYHRQIRNPYDLEPEEEALIGQYFKEEYDADFVFVTHYPSKKRPFYAMDDPADPTYTLSFDLLYQGLEITTGGQRIHDYNRLMEKIEKRGMESEGMEQYLSVFKHGMPPHGGLGIGLERLTMKLVGEDNVRETTLFPRDLSRLEP